jgi:DNA-binding MarR family transcriptional regulator
MRQAANGGSDRTDIERMEESRQRNMRQLLLRASRIVNRRVVEGLNARGYETLRAAHTTLLSNMDLAGSTVTEAAERAGISKQAMGRLATELETMGYIAVSSDPRDARVRFLQFTEAGKRLMGDSFQVMEEVERRCARSVGAERLAAALEALADLIAQEEKP